jgi:hypothetical protein
MSENIIEKERYFRPGQLLSDLHIRERLARINRHASMRVIGKRIGVSRQHIHAVINGRTKPGPKILAFFGLERIELYKNNKLGRPPGGDGIRWDDRDTPGATSL